MVNQRAVRFTFSSEEKRGGTEGPFCLAVMQRSSMTGPNGAMEAVLSTTGAVLALPLCVQSQWQLLISSYCHQAGIAQLSSGQESVLGMQWAQLIHVSANQMRL